MSTVTQRIPNFLLGISQQPDNRKFPGQLRDSVNTFPDYALGLLKRPGGQFNSELYGATSSGKWFPILRDPVEKYVAQYDDNTFRVWSLIDGSPRVVDMGNDTGVPGTCNLTNYQTDLDAYNTAVSTTATRLTELNEAHAAYAEAVADSLATQQALFSVNYNALNNLPTNYTGLKVGDVQQIITSGILKTSAGVYIVKNNDTIVEAAAALPDNYALGSEYTNEYPLLASQGYRVYQALLTTGATGADSLTITAAGSGLVDGTYTELETATTGTGQGLTVDIVVSGGVVTTATINDQGTQWNESIPAAFYDDGDTVTLTDAAYSAVSFEYQSPVQEAFDAVTTAQTNYDNAVTAEGTARTNYQDELDNCEITAIPSDGYLNGATADDIELLTLNDYTFVLNKAKEIAFTADQTAAKQFQAFVVIKVVGTGHYRIYLDGTLRGEHNAGAGGDVDSIINDLVSDIDGNTFGTTTFSATAVGPGIYISADADFTITAVGAPGDDSVFAFKDSVPTVASLPLQCHNGYKVEIVNSIDIDVDNMYVQFVTDTGENGVQPTNGPGVWEETSGWEINTTLDPLTMPHLLVRLPDGSFYFGPPDGTTHQGITLPSWGTRDVGDETTNPDPSFVGNTISNIFFYRNRLGFLSGESVIMSRAGSYFNFFVNTALTVTDDDPIDINASSIKPVNLRYVRPTSVGLVLFSDNEQFILSTESDILSPTTSKINGLSSYECDPDVEAVTLGTSLAFISKTPLYSRLFEINNISTTNPPNMAEPTQYVPELVPETIDSFIASPALSLMSLGTIGNSTVYQFRFAQQGNQRTVTTWYKWVLTGTLLDQFFDVSTYYAVVANGNNEVYIQSYELTQASEEGFLTLPTGEKTDVCLDLWNVNPYRTYDTANDTTRLFLPYDEVTGGTFAVVVLGGYIGQELDLTSASIGSVLYPTVEGTAGAFYVDLNGDYRGLNLIIGYTYDMEVELPKFFLSKVEGQTASTDFTSDLIIHRIKVSTGLSGSFKYQINITGRPEWNQIIESIQPSIYPLNNVNLSAESVHTVPIYQRNDNLSLKIIETHLCR